MADEDGQCQHLVSKHRQAQQATVAKKETVAINKSP
jgi:hypothetical protein